jgi:hypothetical protein
VTWPVGISPALGRAQGETWLRGNRWPPENPEPPVGAVGVWPRNGAKTFSPQQDGVVKLPPKAWSREYFGVVLLTEFAKGTDWASFNLPDWKTFDVEAELKELTELMEFRPGVMAEALAQRTRPDTYFASALGFSASTHPSTAYLIEGMMRIGEFQAMYHKAKHQRPRASQLAPQLLPPIPVPGHASYPSGHATEAHLVQQCLAEVFRLAEGVIPSATQAGGPLERLAQRIARNREVLGLHYPSDSAAGRALAVRTFELANSDNCPTIKSLVAAAANEWLEYAR